MLLHKINTFNQCPPTLRNDLENLAVLLATAGVNYFMGLPMGDDIMLNYQSTSFHDNQGDCDHADK
jgi:ethanolamine ammonia-lyase large subunit